MSIGPNWRDLARADAGIGAVLLTNADRGGALLGPFMRRLLKVLYGGKPEAVASIEADASNYRKVVGKERARIVVNPGLNSLIKSCLLHKKLLETAAPVDRTSSVPPVRTLILSDLAKDFRTLRKLPYDYGLIPLIGQRTGRATLLRTIRPNSRLCKTVIEKAGKALWLITKGTPHEPGRASANLG